MAVVSLIGGMISVIIFGIRALGHNVSFFTLIILTSATLILMLPSLSAFWSYMTLTQLLTLNMPILINMK